MFYKQEYNVKYKKIQHDRFNSNQNISQNISQNKAKRDTIVSGNAGDEKNLPLGGHRFIFFNRFSGDVLFSSLVLVLFLYSCFFFACLFVF